MIKTHEVYYPLYKTDDKFIFLITGGRGCEHPDTLVMMADLTTKKIKDLVVGDKVMGDDGTARTVLETLSGRSMMFRVHSCYDEGANDYFVNDTHILTLWHNNTYIDIPITDYLALSDKANYYGVRKVVNRVRWHEINSPIKITEEGEGEWCGIMIDGNHRYLHSDGVVTHNSGKSYGVGTFIERLTFELGKNDGKKIAHQILYTRYTMVSAEISVIPEFLEKVDADGTTKYFHKTKRDVSNMSTGSTVMFRGIHTSSGNQTAKLKSIHGVTVFVVDEAEEWVSEKEFETIMLSIRQKGLKNLIIIIMNPSDSNHFIYKRYIENTHKLVEYDGVPVQISTHPNVLHIHTTYLDNMEHLSQQFLDEVRVMKEQYPEKYAHIVMGRWADVAEGAIFKAWGIVDEFPSTAKNVGKGLDFGYANDPSACVKFGEVWTPEGVDLYLDEQFYATGMLVSDLIAALKAEDGKLQVYADSADPRLIDEIALGGVIIYAVQKFGGSIVAGIEKMKDYNHIFVTKRSINLQHELRNYTWDKDKDGNYINIPIDAYNHCIDASRYGILGKIMGRVIRKELKNGTSSSSSRPKSYSMY